MSLTKAPNVIFVFADQWRASACGFDGNNDVITPRIDEFAASSLHLPHAIASTPVCTPYRASLLTGMNPDRHGLFLNDAPLNPKFPTIGKAFRTAGYSTAYIGKWHVDGNGRESYIPPERRHGFDYWKVLECTHNYNQSAYYSNDSAESLTWEGYDAFAQTEDALRFLEGQRDEPNPTFLMLSWGPPHNPYGTAPQRFQDLYDPSKLTLRPNVPKEMEADVRRDLAGYYAHCSALDEAFGRLLDGLDALGIGEDTLLVFTSDHGDFIGSHGLYEKQAPWEESIRVPLLMRWPEGFGAQGGVLDLVWQTTDFYPSLCALASVPIPEGASLQGRDRSGHLLNKTLPPEDENYAFLAGHHVYGNWPIIASGTDPYGVWPKSQAVIDDDLFQAREFRGIRTLTHTYCEDLKGPWLLYENETDPYQLSNLAVADSHAQLSAGLSDRLKHLLDNYDDAFLPGGELAARWNYRLLDNGNFAGLNDDTRGA